MRKHFLSLLVIGFILMFSFVVRAEIVLTDENVDSYVGKKIIDVNAVVDIDSNRMNKMPYKVFSNWNKSGHCVDYVCARHWEKLKMTYAVATGNGKDCAKNHQKANGKKMTSIQTGLTYTVQTYFNDNGANIKENSWVSFESSTSTLGHVVFVEYVKTDSNGITQIYYTENVNAGILKKASLEKFVGGNLSSSSKKYLGTACYELEGTSEKKQPQTYSEIKGGEYYISNSGYRISVAKDSQSKNSLSADNASKQAKMVFEVIKDGKWNKIVAKSSSSNYVLNVWCSTNSTNGSEVTLYKNTNHGSQRWYFEECGTGYLIHPGDNTSLSLTRDTSTNKIYVKTTTKASNQIWNLDSATHEHSYTTKYETSHPHKQYKICDCGDEYYTGNTRTVDTCEICNPPKEECRHSVQSMYYETKHPHKEYGICDACGAKEYTGEYGTDEDCDQCHEHSYTTKYESSHPHKQYKICSCGDKYYTGKTKTVDGCNECHDHDYATEYDSSHPHKQYKICDCGDMYYTGKTRNVDSCTKCNPEEDEETPINNPSSSAKNVTVTIPKFAVTINGSKNNNTYAKYPYIVYNDITYFPMTYNGARFLKVNCDWTKENGLVISKREGAGTSTNENATQSSKNKNSYTATTATGIIKINGKYIDNSEEPYPILVFRDVTYFPLTWRFAVTEFGWDYSFTNAGGLVINSK